MPLTELLLLCRAGVSLPALGCRGRLDLHMETWRIPGPSLTCGGRTRSSPHSMSETTAEGIAPAKSETQKYLSGLVPGHGEELLEPLQMCPSAAGSELCGDGHCRPCAATQPAVTAV